MSKHGGLPTDDIFGTPCSPPPPFAFQHQRQTAASKLDIKTQRAPKMTRPKVCHSQELLWFFTASALSCLVLTVYSVAESCIVPPVTDCLHGCVKEEK